MARLDQIANIVTKAILDADMMFDAVLHRVTVTQDEGGNTTETETDIPCKGLIQNASYRQQQSDGYVAGSVGVLIMRHTIPDRTVTTDDEFTCLGGPWAGIRWQLYGKDGDPAGATVELLGKS